MFTRSDRSLGAKGPRRPLVIVLVLAAVVVVVAAGYRLRRPAPQPPSPALPANAAAQLSASDRLPVILHVPANGALQPTSIEILRRPDVQAEARETLSALLARGESTLLRGLMLRGVFLHAGTAYIDLAPAGQREPVASAREELLAVYGMANSLIQNFPDVRQVRFLVDGREAQTLAGHIDLTRSYGKRTDLVKN